MGALLSKPKIPEAPKPVPMPDVDDVEAQAAKQREFEKARSRSGRASTILSGNNYNRTQLGG